MPGHYNNANPVGYGDIIPNFLKLMFSSVMDKKSDVNTLATLSSAKDPYVNSYNVAIF